MNTQAQKPQYIAEFRGHLVRHRPDHFPDIVKDYQMFEAGSNQEIAIEINRMTGRYVHGMAVMLDPAALIDTTKVTTRVFIPMHMISYITCKVSQFTGVTIDPDGTVHFPDGEEVPIQ